MRNLIGVFLLLLLSGCNDDEFVYWTDTEASQIQRLDEANISYDIRNGEIWIKENDMTKVIACCS